MFTDTPPLPQRVRRMIDDVPIVDPHTHLRAVGPQARDLDALLSYHWVRSELIAVGMSPTTWSDPSLNGPDRLRVMLPYLKRMRSTAMGWTLRKMLRDLYDVLEPDLDESILERLEDQVQTTGRDPSWAVEVLERRCRLHTYVTSLGNAAESDAQAVRGGGGPIPSRTIGTIKVRYMLDAHYLFCPGVATDLTPFFPGRTEKIGYYDALCEAIGQRPDSTARLDRAVGDWLERVITGPTRFSNVFIPIETRFRPPDVVAADAALGRAARGQSLSASDLDELIAAVSWAVLGWHHERSKAFQIAVGAEYFICDGKSIPRFDPTWTTEMARVFHHFGHARFDLMMASAVMTHDLAVLARQFPNVYLSGYWWHNFHPAAIESIIATRLELAPAMKVGGFLCDAYTAEWTYGKLELVKLGLTNALCRLIESRFLDEEDTPALLQQILHNTPRDLYDLNDPLP
ncbi:hypothetical protein Isop_2134 [Isosphaera pallida ATCC 43644]|jgi:glucuronate isomerase|uniref:Glucuronate isomerase n=1 Tax=Isosphaera pallida (strain ATCC 43644 / DSM 9630 / IS1B) TaxID=575540 RepID=E8R4B2_ISOPI|nr:hypothetical protein [Isosphaera pallida]ADV62713.1 hypothetical protein Isop_2134 [Isosphaera pallida ATCC 43644]